MGRLLLVRHGQASFGAEDYDVLSETGWEQGRRLGARLARAGVRPTVLLRGAMHRHRETLEAMCDAAGWDQPDRRALATGDAAAPRTDRAAGRRPGRRQG